MYIESNTTTDFQLREEEETVQSIIAKLEAIDKKVDKMEYNSQALIKLVKAITGAKEEVRDE